MGGGTGARPTVEFRGDGIRPLDIAAVHDNRGALSSKHARDLGADARTAAGDERPLASELEIHRQSTLYGFMAANDAALLMRLSTSGPKTSTLGFTFAPARKRL